MLKNKTQKTITRSFLATILLTLLLVALGCGSSEDGILLPTTDTVNEAETWASAKSDIALLAPKTKTDIEDAAATNQLYTHYTCATLGEFGGKLSAGATKLIVPPKALNTPTFLWMGIIEDAGKRIYFEFGEHGTEFAIPAQIELSWSTMKDITSSEELILYYYDDSNGKGKWLEETTAVWDDIGKKATLFINHFSKYYYDRL